MEETGSPTWKVGTIENGVAQENFKIRLNFVIKQTTEILLKVKEKITNESDMDWTCFETADELRKEIDGFILRLNQGDNEVFKDIYVHFLPASTLQEHALQNGWTVEYMKLAEEFDRIYQRHK